MERIAYRRVSSSDQSLERQLPDEKFDKEFDDFLSANAPNRSGLQQAMAVSYTHLTLPTIHLV